MKIFAFDRSSKINVHSNDIIIQPDYYSMGFHVNALWRGKQVGISYCIWVDEVKTRLRISYLNVKDNVVLKPGGYILRPKMGNFQGQGIGKMILREIIRIAPIQGACELFGNVVERDLAERGFLLDWYAKEGFEISAPDPSERIPHVNQIKMRF